MDGVPRVPRHRHRPGRGDYDIGWFTDPHGHGHEVPRPELGYLLTGAQLRLSDVELDSAGVEGETSFRSFSERSPLSFSQLLRGPTSLGTLFDEAGYPVTPSGPDPAPAESEPFFSGGDNTRVHGCLDGGPACGVQIEHNRAGVRDDDEQLAAYAHALYDVYDTYLRTNFGILVRSPEQGVAALRAEIRQLVDDGVLPAARSDWLDTSLDTARAWLDGDPAGARRALVAFRLRVWALAWSGSLDDDPATWLRTLAKRVIQTTWT